MTLVERLRQSPMFEEFTDDNLRVLAKSMQERTFQKGEVIIREGDSPKLTENAMYLILEGMVVVTTQPRSEEDLGLLHMMHAGEILGLVALVADTPRSATCRAGETTRVASLTRTAFNVLFRSNMVVAGRFQYAVARQLACDVRACDAYLSSLLAGKEDAGLGDPLARSSRTATMCPARASKGTYVLLLGADAGGRVRIGRLGTLEVALGVYLYVGSAFGSGGLAARIGRHARPARDDGASDGHRRHWHVDYLREVTDLVACWYTVDAVRREHLWAEVVGALPAASAPLPGFGSSDCRCLTHLFHFPEPPAFALFRDRVAAAAPGHAPIRSDTDWSG